MTRVPSYDLALLTLSHDEPFLVARIETALRGDASTQMERCATFFARNPAEWYRLCIKAKLVSEEWRRYILPSDFNLRAT
jgi:hypothetical protein